VTGNELPGRATPAVVAATPAQIELERTLKASGVDQLAKSFFNEETMGLFFNLMRGVASGKDADLSPALEKKMDQLAEDLPKKMAPVMAKMLDVAEQEMKRAMKEQAAAEAAKAAPKQ
jgi:hypothetical protein